MISEKEYKGAKKRYYGCLVMLSISIVLLIIVVYRKFNTTDTEWINVISAGVNVALFCKLSLDNRKVMRKYEQQ